MTIDQAVDWIRRRSDYIGQDIRLLSCSTGALDDGVAQQVANKMGVKVLAPTTRVAVYEDGSHNLLDDGIWKVFSPGGSGGVPYLEGMPQP